MKTLATILSAAAIIVCLSNCADIPHDLTNDDANNRSACQFDYHDFLYCW